LNIAKSLCLITFHCVSLIIVAFSRGIPGTADLAHNGHCFREYQQFHMYAQTCERSYCLQ
jgi:hypothetical protein